MRRMQNICKCVLLYIIFVEVQFASAGGTNRLVIDWENRFTEVGKQYTICAAAPALNQCVIVAGSSVDSQTSQVTTNSELFLEKIGGDGKVRTRLRLNLPQKLQVLEPLLRRRYVRDVLEIKGGEMLLVTEIEEGNPVIVRVSAVGDVVVAVPIPQLVGLPAEILASRLVPTTDGDFVILGKFRNNAILLKLDRDGNLLWQKTMDGADSQFFVDAVPTERGGFVAVANSGKYNKFGFGMSEVWVVAFDADGNDKQRVKFPGRQGSICQCEGGNLAVVFDKSMATGQDIWMQLLDNNLKLLWTKAVISVKLGFSSSFRVVPVSSGGFIVVGLRDFRMWLSKRDKDGGEIWSYTNPGSPSSWNLSNLIRLGNKYTVLYSAFTTKGKQVDYQIGALGFHEDD